jgi:hypothetical protein
MQKIQASWAGAVELFVPTGVAARGQLPKRRAAWVRARRFWCGRPWLGWQQKEGQQHSRCATLAVWGTPHAKRSVGIPARERPGAQAPGCKPTCVGQQASGWRLEEKTVSTRFGAYQWRIHVCARNLSCLPEYLVPGHAQSRGALNGGHCI